MLRFANGILAAAVLLLSQILAGSAASAQELPRFLPPDSSRTVCTQQYDPVCASRGNRLRTFGNACEAQRSGYRIEYGGECGSAGRDRRPDRPGACSREYAPVCAVGRDGRQTFANLCEAQRAGYRLVHPGECRGRDRSRSFCTREYAPVCAIGRGGRQTFGNACEAERAGYRILRSGRCR